MESELLENNNNKEENSEHVNSVSMLQAKSFIPFFFSGHSRQSIL